MSSNKKYGGAVSATLNGILDLFRKREPIGVLHEEDRIDGKKTMITGASSGLGLATAIELARRGGDMILLCRSRVEETLEKVKRESGSETVRVVHVDLASYSSQIKALDEIENLTSQLDIVVLNAAMVPSSARKTQDGYDEMFTVNYLSKQVWVDELRKRNLIRESQETGKTMPRIVFVSSESHRSGKDLNPERLGEFEDYNAGKVIGLYGTYKLALNTLAVQLDRELNDSRSQGFGDKLAEKPAAGVGVYALCPGPVASNIARESPTLFKPVLKLVFNAFFSSPEKAAVPVVYLCCSPDLNGQSGVYLHLMAHKAMDERALDPAQAAVIQERARELIAEIAESR